MRYMDICKSCGLKTEAMYGLNDGLYCEKHIHAALANETIANNLALLSEKWRYFGRDNSVFIRNIKA